MIINASQYIMSHLIDLDQRVQKFRRALAFSTLNRTFNVFEFSKGSSGA